MADLQIKSSLIDEIVEFLVSAPTPEQIIAFHPSPLVQDRARYLLEKNREGILTIEENEELEEFSRFTHLIRLLKAKAHQKLAQP